MARSLEWILRRDRVLIALALGALSLLSWAAMFAPAGAGSSGAGPGPLMPCCGARFSVTFAMWVVMMAGMIIPSVAPMVLTHAAIARRRRASSGGGPFFASGLFLAGYL